MILVLSANHPKVLGLLDLVEKMDSALRMLLSDKNMGGKDGLGQFIRDVAWCLTDNNQNQPYNPDEDWRTEVSVTVSLCETARVLYVPGPIGGASQNMRRVIKEFWFVIRRRDDEWIIPTGTGKACHTISDICNIAKSRLILVE